MSGRLTRKKVDLVLSADCPCGHLALNHLGNEEHGWCPTCKMHANHGFEDDPCALDMGGAYAAAVEAAAPRPEPGEMTYDEARGLAWRRADGTGKAHLMGGYSMRHHQPFVRPTTGYCGTLLTHLEAAALVMLVDGELCKTCGPA